MRKAVILGLVQLPLQIILALALQTTLINNSDAELVKWWYLLISLSPVFTLLECAYPQIAVNFFNRGVRACEAQYFIKSSLLTITFAQLLFYVFYLCLFTSERIEVTAFFLAMYIRSVSNMLFSIVYSLGGVVRERIYKVLFSCFFPLVFIMLAHIYPVTKELILFVWLVSSLVLFIFAVLNFKSINTFSLCNESSGGKYRHSVLDNVKLIITTLPGIFIFNLSIYYLEIFYPGKTSSEIITFGLFLQLFNVFNMLNALVPSVYIPKISSLFNKNLDIQYHVANILDFNVFVSIVVTSSAIFFGSKVLELFIRPEHVNLNGIIYIFVAAVVVESMQTTLTSISTGTGCYKFHIPSLLSSIIVMLMSTKFVPLYGSYGLGLSIITAQLCTCFPFNIYISCKRIGVKIHSVLSKWMLIVLVAVASYWSCSFIVNFPLSVFMYLFFLSWIVFFFRKCIFAVIKM